MKTLLLLLLPLFGMGQIGSDNCGTWKAKDPVYSEWTTTDTLGKHPITTKRNWIEDAWVHQWDNMTTLEYAPCGKGTPDRFTKKRVCKLTGIRQVMTKTIYYEYIPKLKSEYEAAVDSLDIDVEPNDNISIYSVDGIGTFRTINVDTVSLRRLVIDTGQFKATRDKEAQIDHFNNIGYNDENDRYVAKVLDRGLLAKIVDKPYDDQRKTRVTLVFDEFEITKDISPMDRWYLYDWDREPFNITCNDGKHIPTVQRRFGNKYNDLAPTTYARIFMMLAVRPDRAPFKNIQEPFVSVEFTAGYDTVWIQPIKINKIRKIEFRP